MVLIATFSNAYASTDHYGKMQERSFFFTLFDSLFADPINRAFFSNITTI